MALAVIAAAVLGIQRWIRNAPTTRQIEPLRLRLLDPAAQRAPTAPTPPTSVVPRAVERVPVPDALDSPAADRAATPVDAAAAKGGGVAADADAPEGRDAFGLPRGGATQEVPSGVATNPGSATGEGNGAAEGARRDVLDAYALRVAEVLSRDKHYPKRARDRHWQGTVLVQLRISGALVLDGVTLRQSSGHPMLDAEAIAKVRRASLPPLPETMRGRDFDVVVPFVFSLE